MDIPDCNMADVSDEFLASDYYITEPTGGVWNPFHLRELHHLPEFDDHVKMDVPTHIYYVDGEPYDLSVTGYTKYFFAEFNADAVIARIRGGKSWNPNHKLFGKTDEEIKASWSEAAVLGTAMHNKIEKFHNIPELYSLPQKDDDILRKYYTEAELESKDFQQFLCCYWNFVSKNNWKPFRTELCIFDRELKLAGTLDMIYVRCKNPDCANSKFKVETLRGMEMFVSNDTRTICCEYIIVDWKRSNPDTLYGFYQGRNPKFGFRACSKIRDTKYKKYGIQVNTYKEILERNCFRIPVSELYLCVFHPDYKGNNDFCVFVISVDTRLVRNMFSDYRRIMKINPQ
jgi:hypothetical protein